MAPVPFIDAVQRLAAALRAMGVEVSTSEVIDAGRVLTVIDLTDRELVRACLRAVMVSRETDLPAFDRAFDQVFGRVVAPETRPGVTGATGADDPGGSAPVTPTASSTLASQVSAAASAGDAGSMEELARRAVDAFAGDASGEGLGRQLVHRIMRSIDLSNMLSAAMRALRSEGDLSELELALRRHEIAAALEAFRRALAAEVERRRCEIDESGVPVVASDLADRPVLGLSTTELRELRRTIHPLARQLAARVTRRRRSLSTGRLDLRRTVRRSLQSGGIPLDPAVRRKHPHRPEVVVLCDVSGSVAEFAHFTFMLTHAVHDVLAGVRSFAFVGGVAEMTEVFANADHEVSVHRILDGGGRPGAVVGLDGHSDYGAVFRQFVERHLDDAVGPRTTVIVTGDGRSNFRDPGVEHFARIVERARRVYWLDPEPRDQWELDDSAMPEYRQCCDGVFEVATVRDLSSVIAELV